MSLTAEQRRQQAGIRESLKGVPDPQQCDDTALERAIDIQAGDILDDADEYEELLQAISGNPRCREAAKELVATSDGALAEHLRDAARDMAMERIRREYGYA